MLKNKIIKSGLAYINEIFTRYWENSILLFLVVMGALVRFVLLDIYPMDRDELARVIPPFDFRALLPPGFYYLFKISAKIFNYSDLGYRLPVFIMSTLAILAIYYLGKALFGKIAGLLASLIYSLLFVALCYANMTKEYAPMMFFSAVTSYLAFKIIFTKADKKIFIPLYFLATFLSLFFGSYFLLLAFTHQMLIFIVYNLLKNFGEIKSYLRSILKSVRLRILTSIIGIIVLLALFLVFRLAAGYFGLYFIIPTLPAIKNYYQDLAYYILEDNNYRYFANVILIFGLLTIPLFKKFRLAFFYLYSFLVLDIILVSILRFSHTAYPFGYPRYHAYSLPLYLVLMTGSVVSITTVVKKIIDLLAVKIGYYKKTILFLNHYYLLPSLIIFYFIYQNLNYEIPMIKYLYNVPTNILLTNYKDAGQFLSDNLKAGDTLVRVKTPGMAHKFNHVNRYLDKNVLASINYSIFPDRTSVNNWYVPIVSGEEDIKPFPDFEKTARIRPTFRFDAPYIYKMEYFGPLISEKYLLNDGTWLVDSSINSELAGNAIDRNYSTAWIGPVKTGDYFALDLGKNYPINSVNYNFGSMAFPQNFIISLSKDGKTWTPVVTSSIPGIHPHNMSRVYFPPALARFIKLEFIIDPLTIIRDISIGEIEVEEVFEKDVGINKENIVNSLPVKRFNFTANSENWQPGNGITNVAVQNGELTGEIADSTGSGFTTQWKNSGEKAVNYLNFAMTVDQGDFAAIILESYSNSIVIKNYKIHADSIKHYYTFKLDDYLPPDYFKENITSLKFLPSNVNGAKFALDFFSLDNENLPGIQVKDENSVNGYAQFIKYEPDEDYNLFQIGNKFYVSKGNYLAHFKIKVDAVDEQWKSKLKPVPSYRLQEYIDPPGVSMSDVMYLSVESTRGTFFELPGYYLLHGEVFKEANKYYDISIPFVSNGGETLSFQGFTQIDRRYPANMYITYPVIEEVK